MLSFLFAIMGVTEEAETRLFSAEECVGNESSCPKANFNGDTWQNF